MLLIKVLNYLHIYIFGIWSCYIQHSTLIFSSKICLFKWCNSLVITQFPGRWFSMRGSVVEESLPFLSDSILESRTILVICPAFPKCEEHWPEETYLENSEVKQGWETLHSIFLYFGKSKCKFIYSCVHDVLLNFHHSVWRVYTINPPYLWISYLWIESNMDKNV